MPDHHGHDETQELTQFRAAKDAFMKEDEQSPLPSEERENFPGLSYYPYNPDLHLQLPLDRDVPAEPITMETSTGSRREYRRVGKIRFEVDGTPAELMIYQGSDGSLFLPLRDATSGKETYGAGRYVEPEMVGDDQVDADLNYLYNPYCAYNEAYSCPLPPIENWLRVPIEAGEKVYRKADS
ncbi:MAG TPA: DUF1684 domain-containing protein [Chloroflexota bacterium]|nr:DUF1684 domain-containing protein [Chloroflexota bacterium]